MKKALAHVEGFVFKVIAGNSYLSHDLFLGGIELPRCQSLIAQLLQFFTYQLHAVVGIVGVATKVDAERARVGIGCKIGLNVIYQPTLFAQRYIQSAIHTRTSQNVIQQIQSSASFIICAITSRPYHDVSLMRISTDFLKCRNIYIRSQSLIITNCS